MTEQTLVLVKPDAVERGLIGDILYRFETKGLRIAGMRMLQFDKELAAKHYADHVGKHFYPRLEKFIMSGPVVAIVLERDDVIKLVRMMMGATDRLEASPGTIRGDHAFGSMEQNLVHGSDSPESAKREIALFFSEDQLFHLTEQPDSSDC